MLLPMLFAYFYLFGLTLALFLYKTSMSINTVITATSDIMTDAVNPLINPILVPVVAVVSVA